MLVGSICMIIRNCLVSRKCGRWRCTGGVSIGGFIGRILGLRAIFIRCLVFGICGIGINGIGCCCCVLGTITAVFTIMVEMINGSNILLSRVSKMGPRICLFMLRIRPVTMLSLNYVPRKINIGILLWPLIFSVLFSSSQL